MAEPVTTDEALRLCVLLARCVADYSRDPEDGDLVVEVSSMSKAVDPDAIGILVGQGEATWRTDNTGPTRHVYDVQPLSGRRQEGLDYQRWENAKFVPVTTRVPRLANVLDRI